MKTFVELSACCIQIDRRDLGSLLHSVDGLPRVFLVPETEDEVLEQREKAIRAKADEFKRGGTPKHIHRAREEANK